MNEVTVPVVTIVFICLACVIFGFLIGKDVERTKQKRSE